MTLPPLEPPRSVVLIEDATDGCADLGRELRVVMEEQPFVLSDARVSGLTAARHLSVGAAVMLNQMQRIENLGDERAQREALGILTGGFEPAFHAAVYFVTFGLLVHVQFQFENLLANLVRALGQAPGRGFSTVVGQVLGALSLSDTGLRDAFMAPALIRNTLHNNGVHRSGTSALEVGGETLHFREGEVWEGDWGVVYFTLRAELRALERILANDVVRSLPMVEDAYAAQQVERGF